MIKLKPTNIFQYYAPVGNSMKIADFGITKKTIPEVTIVASNTQGPELPNDGKKNNPWLYVLAGVAIVIGGICLINYINKKDEEEIKKI